MYTKEKGVKINKMVEMDIALNDIDKQKTIAQEQKIDQNTKVILEKVENSSFETYIRLKRITENITWNDYNENIEYYRFKVASIENDTIASNCYDIGKKVYKNEKLIEDFSELKDNDIVKVENMYAVILGEQTNFKKLKVMQTKVHFLVIERMKKKKHIIMQNGIL